GRRRFCAGGSVGGGAGCNDGLLGCWDWGGTALIAAVSFLAPASARSRAGRRYGNRRGSVRHRPTPVTATAARSVRSGVRDNGSCPRSPSAQLTAAPVLRLRPPRPSPIRPVFSPPGGRPPG